MEYCTLSADRSRKTKTSRTSASKPLPSNATPVQPIASNQDTISTAPVSTSVISRHKYCPKCKKEIPLDVAKCPRCGKRWSGGDVDINPIWGFVTLTLGLALVSLAPILALIFLIATIFLVVKSMKNKKSKALPAASFIPLKTKAEQRYVPDVRTVAQSPLDGALEETTEKLCDESDNDNELDEPVESESDICPVVAKTYKATGINYYMDNIMRLATENPGYNMSKTDIIGFGITDERIWKYDFCPCVTELIPEPDNPHDPKAIKVVVDGEHIGYIKAGSCSHLLKVINEGRIRSIICKMGGGPYKEVREEIDDDSYESIHTVEHGETNIAVRLTVHEEK